MSRTTKGCAIALLAAAVLAVLALGTALLAAVIMGPQLAMDAMVEDAPSTFDHPVSPEAVDPIIQAMVQDLRATRTARLTGPQLTRLIVDELGDKGTGGISIRDGVATADLSMDARDKDGVGGWMNVHVVGSFEVKDGWVSTATVQEFDFSGWDLGSWLQDGPITDQVNKELSKLRREDPGTGEKLDQVERVALEGDAVVLTVTQEGLKYVRASRQE